MSERGYKLESAPEPYPKEGKLLVNGMLEELGATMEEFSKFSSPENKQIIIETSQ
ncbi:MAG: hypothetical protein QF747_01975 [Patescibacteria group bacterium]|jgi:hypothetical protein|nr:hypothetical protein [Patescibacteria group bacterium]MDP6756088.1 hypothetical protein [Patescibacteria group bacterium]|tara:strand:- start:12785 stop:12949 length:165 start_codon:yes stop_codon:yes gene_type:complete